MAQIKSILFLCAENIVFEVLGFGSLSVVWYSALQSEICLITQNLRVEQIKTEHFNSLKIVSND